MFENFKKFEKDLLEELTQGSFDVISERTSSRVYLKEILLNFPEELLNELVKEFSMEWNSTKVQLTECSSSFSPIEGRKNKLTVPQVRGKIS